MKKAHADLAIKYFSDETGSVDIEFRRHDDEEWQPCWEPLFNPTTQYREKIVDGGTGACGGTVSCTGTGAGGGGGYATDSCTSGGTGGGKGTGAKTLLIHLHRSWCRWWGA